MRIRRLLWVCLPSLATACMSENIELRETDVLMPAMRVILPERAGAKADPDGPQGPDRYLELAGSVAFDDITPPDSGHFSILEATAAYRRSTFGTETASFDLLVGAGYNRLDLDVVDGIQALDRNVNRYGPMIGGVLSIEVAPRVTLYGRGTFMYLIPDATSGQAETGVRLGISDNVHAFGAWRHWRYRLENLTGSTEITDIDIKAEGLAFGLELVF